MTDYYVGQKVVCIDDSFDRDAEYNEIYPKLNCIYTIRAVTFDADNDQFLKFIEIQNQVFEYDDIGNDECAFYSANLRPLVETKSEVSFTIGADPDSEKWDNRKVKVK